jgi:hypothetical protein
LEKLINSYEQKDVSDIVPLSFAKYGSPFPSQARCVREYKPNSDDTANYRAEVTVSTDISLESRTARVRGGKIQPPNPSVADVLALATIGDLPVEMVFLSSKSEDIKKFISALNATKGYEGEDIGERCVALEKELARSFSVADKAIAYWALMSLYSRKIAANKNGKDCVKDIKAQWAALGLGTEGLPHLTSQPIVVPTASVTEVDRTEIRSSNPAYVREITKNVTSTSTFSSFPAPLQ